MLVRYSLLIIAILWTLGAQAELLQGHNMKHSAMHSDNQPLSTRQQVPTEPGQTAFATIQEIVMLLDADPNTNWREVNIDALRQHLIDMDNVTLRANIRAESTTDGVQYHVTSEDPAVTASIQRMVTNHALSMSDSDTAQTEVNTVTDGIDLTLTSSSEEQVDRLRALGFVGWLTLTMHHQAHHLALARGESPH